MSIDLGKILTKTKILKESNEKIRINLILELYQAECLTKRFNFQTFR